MKALWAQTKWEVRQTLRNGEQLLLVMGIPILLLVFFSVVDVFETGTDDPIDFLAPGVLAMAVMSTSMTSLGIATGFERSYGVLKRLGTTPLGRGRLLAAKTLTVLVVIVLQAIVISLIALLLGWSPEPSVTVVAAVALGAAAFAGLGMTMAGSLRGEINLAAANGLFLVLLLFGDMVIPLEDLPGPVEAVARFLPSAALSETVQASLTEAVRASARAWAVLAAWAVAMPALAAKTFRWH